MNMTATEKFQLWLYEKILFNIHVPPENYILRTSVVVNLSRYIYFTSYSSGFQPVVRVPQVVRQMSLGGTRKNKNKLFINCITN